MLFMNSDEIDDLQDYFRGPEIPENVRKAAAALQRLKDWTNENSDGWAYWKAPLTAANTLMARLMEAESAWRAGRPVPYMTDDELYQLMGPIQSLLAQHAKKPSADILFPPDPPSDVPDGMAGQAAINWRKGNRAALSLTDYWFRRSPQSKSYGDEGSPEFEDAIKNLLTDLRHLAYRAGSDFEALSSEASGQYCLELDMEDPDHDKS
ncbi:hypothetical protein BJD78_gp80 [Arthrobacter phage KellEzio]|uniref:Uncharacterized protein n=1 Tax=Arthrobacter phage KellEzio TaxID=1796995 RepID=A0A140G6G5_9CAUD|nr:hypothetical protein BJD78_gp80 [Arthrobacter phage KellEzio]AMM44250.1 hypothetical protein KELLEZIO_80 [Arthrobacter phage KellEzio]